MSYHLIVHLKAKGTATLWPDKVAVLHAWSRRSPSLGFSPLDRAIGRPRCSFDRGFTVTLPELWPPAGRYAHAESGERGCPVLYESQSAPPPICTMRWRFTGATTKRSDGDPRRSDQIRQNRSSKSLWTQVRVFSAWGLACSSRRG